MPRTDDGGREIQAVLCYLLNRAVPATEIYGALGIARNTYHKRIEEPDYPNGEEIRLLAEHFGLNYADLLVQFGLLTEEHIQAVLAPPLAAKSTTTRRRVKKLSELELNPQVHPL